MIGIITVNYNSYDQTREFLQSLARVRNCGDASVYIADSSEINQSFPIKNNPFKTYVERIKNKGYAHGINHGIHHFQNHGITQYCVVNNDIYFDTEFLNRVSHAFSKYHMFGGKIYYAKGYEYHKDRYTTQDLGKILWYAGGILDWNNAYTIHRGVNEVDRGQYNKEEQTEFITGCLMCFNETVVKKTGLWDERYFLYYEDADYCERAKREGFSLHYDPRIIIWHKNAQSTGGAGSSLHERYQKINRVRFGMTYAPLRTKLHLFAQNLWIVPLLFQM